MTSFPSRMIQATGNLTIATTGRGLIEITSAVTGWLSGKGVSEGLLTLFIRHTSASLIIQENADPSVLADLEAFFHRLVPEDRGLYRHNDEGPDDMPGHIKIKAALTQTQLSIPVLGGALALGTWQGIHVFEHRAAAHRRQVALHLIGT